MLLISCQTLAAGQLSTSVGHWGMSGRYPVGLTSVEVCQSAKGTKLSKHRETGSDVLAHQAESL